MLARREHSRRELSLKLQKRFEEPELIDLVLDKLIAENWLNEHRFVEAYIRYRASNGFGPIRIRQELLQRGIKDELIDKFLLVLPELDWQELAEKARVKKFGAVFPKLYPERMKQLKFLYYRGFENFVESSD